MSTYSEILNAALSLPVSERTELADILLASTDVEDGKFEISPAWREEIVRRSAEVASGTANFTTYEQMRERARRDD